MVKLKIQIGFLLLGCLIILNWFYNIYDTLRPVEYHLPKNFSFTCTSERMYEHSINHKVSRISFNGNTFNGKIYSSFTVGEISLEDSPFIPFNSSLRYVVFNGTCNRTSSGKFEIEKLESCEFRAKDIEDLKNKITNGQCQKNNKGVRDELAHFRKITQPNGLIDYLNPLSHSRWIPLNIQTSRIYGKNPRTSTKLEYICRRLEFLIFPSSTDTKRWEHLMILLCSCNETLVYSYISLGSLGYDECKMYEPYLVYQFDRGEILTDDSSK